MKKHFVAGVCLLILCGCSREVSPTDTGAVPPSQEERVQDLSAGGSIAAESVERTQSETAAFPSQFDPVETVEDAVHIGDVATEQLVTALPGHPDALEMRARFEFEFGSPDVAASLWREILTVSPRYTHALAGLGDYEEDRGNLGQAATFYRRAAESAPNEPTRIVKLASCLSEMGRLDEAEELLERACETHPSYVDACTELGAVLLQQRKYERAREVYRKAVKFDPDNSKAYGGLATVSVRLGDHELAADDLKMHRKCRRQQRAALADQRRAYDDLAAISSDITDLLHNTALVYLSQTRNEVAVPLFEQAAALSESHLPSRQLLARLAEQENKFEEAARWQQQVVQLSPADFQATLQHAMLLGAADRIDQAEETVTSFVEANPEDAAAAMTLAQFYVDVKPNLEKAIEVAERGAQLSAEADDMVFLAALQEHAGETETAAATLEVAASLPGSDAAQQRKLFETLRARFQSNPRLTP